MGSAHVVATEDAPTFRPDEADDDDDKRVERRRPRPEHKRDKRRNHGDREHERNSNRRPRIDRTGTRPSRGSNNNGNQQQSRDGEPAAGQRLRVPQAMESVMAERRRAGMEADARERETECRRRGGDQTGKRRAEPGEQWQVEKEEIAPRRQIAGAEGVLEAGARGAGPPQVDGRRPLGSANRDRKSVV